MDNSIFDKLPEFRLIKKLNLPYDDIMLNKEVEDIYYKLLSKFNKIFEDYLYSEEYKFGELNDRNYPIIISHSKNINLNFNIIDLIDEYEFNNFYNLIKLRNNIYYDINKNQYQIDMNLISFSGIISTELYHPFILYQLFHIKQDIEYLKIFNDGIFQKLDNIKLYTTISDIINIANFLKYMFKNEIDFMLNECVKNLMNNPELKSIEETLTYKYLNQSMVYYDKIYDGSSEKNIEYFANILSLSMDELEELINYSITYFNYRISKANTDYILNKP